MPQINRKMLVKYNNVFNIIQCYMYKFTHVLFSTPDQVPLMNASFLGLGYSFFCILGNRPEHTGYAQQV